MRSVVVAMLMLTFLVSPVKTSDGCDDESATCIVCGAPIESWRNNQLYCPDDKPPGFQYQLVPQEN